MAPFSWWRDGVLRFQSEQATEERYYSQEESDDEGSTGAVQGSSLASSTEGSSCSAWSSRSSSPISEATEEGGPYCDMCDVEAGEEPLFACPCKCTYKYVHRSCLEQQINQVSVGTSCLSCGEAYPVRRETKPIWRWFSEEESRGDALLFTANLTFGCGNFFVLAMAWLYVLREAHSSPWQPVLLGGLTVFTIFWLVFGFFRFHILYKPLAHWRSTNTRLVALLDCEDTQ
ncbi:hypothetical protein HPB48_018239 [Haemaphysalis longicornis]|uniref:RING-CH-type domain-containing protein n=1 Tax=Haemaphysalis longicornis TaxID=44386 RepID=A0A9J6FDN5_HAELO|nr:hypothetical protein HPB48_018239 [Haemaphysalis longicornis]